MVKQVNLKAQRVDPTHRLTPRNNRYFHGVILVNASHSHEDDRAFAWVGMLLLCAKQSPRNPSKLVPTKVFANSQICAGSVQLGGLRSGWDQGVKGGSKYMCVCVC